MDILTAPDRWDKITDLIEENGKASIYDIVEVLKVSPATARRDLRQMHESGLVSRTRGGATLPTQSPSNTVFNETYCINVSEKEAIGKCAAKLISPGDTVFIDGGSTAYYTALNLDVPDVVIITNAHAIVGALLSKRNIEVILVGGLVRSHSGATVGPDAVNMINRLRTDKAIMGANGFSVTEGITVPNTLIAEVKQAIVRHTKELIVVADHTKLGDASLFSVASVDKVNKLVTDTNATSEQIDAFKDRGIDVVMAPINGKRNGGKRG